MEILRPDGMGIFPGPGTCPARTALGGGDKSVGELNTVLGQRINMWCPHGRMSVTSEILPAGVIGYQP